MSSLNDSSASTASSDRHISLPAKVVVSLKAGAVLAIANILCVAIFSWTWAHVRAEPKTISVTGSAKKVIRSDLIVWSAKVSVVDPDLTAAYDKLKADTDRTLAYLKQHNAADKEITVSAIGSWKRRQKDEKGNDTEKIAAYELWQTIEISSADLNRVSTIARNVTALIKDGVYLESSAPKYLYTKLADLKITMLAEATKDATLRARQIATNSGATLGSITQARMGVMQINALNSDEATGSGVNDTASLDKQITAVVSAEFSLK
jgi:hypothetical protein